jgi:hypothetical protein
MSVKLESNNNTIINVHDMKDGQIAEIVNWGDNDYIENYIGKIVQKLGDILITVGEGVVGTSSTIFNRKEDNYFVRLLNIGEKIEIVENGELKW